MSLIKPRISDIDVENVNFSVGFHKKTYKIRGVRTCYGDFLVHATSYSMLLTASEETPACQHFNKVYKRCIQLNHNNVELCDHLQVIFFTPSYIPPITIPTLTLPTFYPPFTHLFTSSFTTLLLYEK